MKIQLKRSNVLQNGAAKPPTAPQMEFGELAVNYNTTDPVLFIKDSSGTIIRLTNIQEVFDGQINVEAGDGLSAAGLNATANQETDTTRTLTAVGAPGYAIDVAADGIRFGDSWVNIPNLPELSNG